MKAKDLVLFLGGAAVGAAVALLMAPESGQQTRRKIKRFYEDEKDKVVDAYKNVRSDVEHEAHKIGKRIKREIKERNR